MATFAEYNTDENFKNNDSSLEELVKIGKSEGLSLDKIKSSLSPAWQKSSKIGNIQTYYDNAKERYKKGGYSGMPTNIQAKMNIDETQSNVTTLDDPKKEEVPLKQKEPETTETVKEEVKTEEKPKKEIPITKNDKEYKDKTTAIIGDEAEQERQNQEELGKRSHTYTRDEIMEMGRDFGVIDDKFLDQIPTFMVKRFADGEFGDPKSGNAQLRLAHFMINGLGAKLKNASNAAMIAAGKSPMFADTTSDYAKYQNTNLQQGLENRWNKYKSETQAAIDMAKNAGMENQKIQNIIREIESDRKMQTAINMMNDKQKLYTLKVYEQAGEELAKLSPKEKVNFFGGAFAMGDDFTPTEAAIVLGSGGIQGIFNEDGSINWQGMQDAVNNAMANMGEENIETQTAGFGGSGSKDVTGTFTLSDGYSFKIGPVMTKREQTALTQKVDELRRKYKNGEISKEDFEKDVQIITDVINGHPISKAIVGGVKSQDRINKEDKENLIKSLFPKQELNDGKKAITYFENNSDLFNYFSKTEKPNYTDAPKDGFKKGYGDYEKALNMFKLLKKNNALQLVGKY